MPKKTRWYYNKKFWVLWALHIVVPLYFYGSDIANVVVKTIAPYPGNISPYFVQVLLGTMLAFLIILQLVPLFIYPKMNWLERTLVIAGTYLNYIGPSVVIGHVVATKLYKNQKYSRAVNALAMFASQIFITLVIVLVGDLIARYGFR